MNHYKKRVLVIEDDDEMRSLLKDFIEEEGYEADSVDKGSEAFRKVAKEPFDFIISGIQMPGLTELDIFPGIKKFNLRLPSP